MGNCVSFAPQVCLNLANAIARLFFATKLKFGNNLISPTPLMILYIIFKQGMPKCKTCGKEGEKDWSDMFASERELWIWEGDSCECKACSVKEKIDKIKYERERKYYEKAKEQLYPRTETQNHLRRIHSNEKWEGTASFYEAWKLPSSLGHLIQPFIGERKGTGFVGDSTGGGQGGAEGNGDGGGGGGGGVSSASSHHAQFEALEEELEIVEEESLSEDDSVHGGRAPHPI